MRDNDSACPSSQNDEYRASSYDYPIQAERAVECGDDVLGMHLYLAAFENLSREANSGVAMEAALESLKCAWQLACKLKERTIAEYIFDRLGAFLSPDELDLYAQQLQELAFDKLEEFGLSREDLRDVTEFITQEATRSLMGGEVGEEADFHNALREALAGDVVDDTADDTSATVPRVIGASDAPRDAMQDDSQDVHAASEQALNEASPQASEPSQDSSASQAGQAGQAATPPRHPVLTSVASFPIRAGRKTSDPAKPVRQDHPLYKDLVGYDSVIETMRTYGVGMQDDPQFKRLVNLLNVRHGVDRMPASDALVFSSSAREDAAHFMEATFSELGLPGIRMRMEESASGMPVLCVMTQANFQPKLNAMKNAFDGEGVLILEDIDLWGAPYFDQSPAEDFGGFIIASLSRGAREAMNLIHSAVERDDVHVLASMSDVSEVDPFFLDLLEPLSIVEIDLPNDEERSAIWADIAKTHPSMRGIDRATLVNYSAHMPRFDIYMAAHEAVDEAYRESLVSREYKPVTESNLFEKLAAYHSLESDEYHLLEDQVVESFHDEFDELERYMNGETD